MTSRGFILAEFSIIYLFLFFAAPAPPPHPILLIVLITTNVLYFSYLTNCLHLVITYLTLR